MTFISQISGHENLFLGSMFILQLTNFDNSDRKQEKRRKSMHRSSAQQLKKVRAGIRTRSDRMSLLCRLCHYRSPGHINFTLVQIALALPTQLSCVRIIAFTSVLGCSKWSRCRRDKLSDDKLSQRRSNMFAIVFTKRAMTRQRNQ